MSNVRPYYLTVLGTRRGLAYVLREEKMAFPATRPISLSVGDRLLLYTVRGIFGDPGRERGRVVASAEVASPVVPLEPRLRLAGQEYISACDLRITGLAPLGAGVVLAELVDKLRIFQPNTTAWSARLRRTLLMLPEEDAELIMELLEGTLQDPAGVRQAYLDRAAAR
jgi:hypothetical protein